MRHLVRSIIAAALVLAAGGCAANGATATHRVYTYSATFPDSPWHPGTTVTIVWYAQDMGIVPSGKPARLTLDVTLSAKFDTVAALKNAPDAGLPTATAPTIVTDTWTGTPTFTTRLRRPADLAPGLYNLAQRVSEPGGASSAGSVITVSR